MAKTSAAVKNRYAAKAYDSLRIIVPKGHKATIQRAAKQEEESINGYVIKAVLGRMGLKKWPEVDDRDSTAPAEDSES